jgi:hypothetical protein
MRAVPRLPVAGASDPHWQRQAVLNMQTRLMGDEPTQRASFQEAMLQGQAHKRKCPLCSTTLKAAARTGLTFESFRVLPT